MRKTTILFIFLIIFSIFTVNVFTINADVSSGAYVVMEAQTGQILHEKEGAKKYPPKNTAKMMTAILALELGNLEDIITISETNDGVLSEGELVSLEEALYVLVLKSSDACAEAIAKHISEKEFPKLMNERAKSLGIVNTHFESPTGTVSDTEYTTAYDMAIITGEALKNPLFKEIFTSKSTLIGGSKTIKTNIDMLNNGSSFYEFATGGLSMSTEKSGCSMISTAQKGMLELIVVLLDSPDTKYTDTKNILEDCFNSFYKAEIDPSLYNIPTAKAIGSLGKRGLITFSLPEELILALPNEVFIEHLNFSTDIKPKYRQDKSYGANLIISANGLKTITIPLISSEEKASSSFLRVVFILFFIILAAILIILGIAAYYIIDSNLKKRRRRRDKYRRALRVKRY